ncbi:hypothetical protein HZA57_03435 [Candidatus Poribacteria bacterium]|nr:hypothetical protein [Candidatus Poribacteria bacterium]
MKKLFSRLLLSCVAMLLSTACVHAEPSDVSVACQWLDAAVPSRITHLRVETIATAPLGADTRGVSPSGALDAVNSADNRTRDVTVRHIRHYWELPGGSWRVERSPKKFRQTALVSGELIESFGDAGGISYGSPDGSVLSQQHFVEMNEATSASSSVRQFRKVDPKALRAEENQVRQTYGRQAIYNYRDMPLANYLHSLGDAWNSELATDNAGSTLILTRTDSTSQPLRVELRFDLAGGHLLPARLSLQANGNESESVVWTHGERQQDRPVLRQSVTTYPNSFDRSLKNTITETLEFLPDELAPANLASEQPLAQELRAQFADAEVAEVARAVRASQASGD